MEKLIFLMGTRPEAIKMAPLILEALARKTQEVMVIFSGQHRDMVRGILAGFGVEIDVDLEVMGSGDPMNVQSGRLIARLDPILAAAGPNTILVVQGDTMTAAAGALAAFQRRVRVAHVEAGLRTGDLQSPWPEEFNRRMISLIADWHFCPTMAAARDLLREGIPSEKIHVVGNTGIDALMKVPAMGGTGVSNSLGALLPELEFDEAKIVLVTLHRRESIGQPLENLFGLLKRQSLLEDRKFLLPLHRNSEVRATAARILGFDESLPMPQLIGRSLWLTDPLEYFEFVAAMRVARLLLTDSGGIQEEGPSLGKPVLIARETTERPEAVNCGSAEIVGFDQELIETRLSELLSDSPRYRSMAQPRFPFGDGLASQRILKLLNGEIPGMLELVGAV